MIGCRIRNAKYEGFGKKSLFCIYASWLARDIDFSTRSFIGSIFHPKIYYILPLYELKLIFDQMNKDIRFWRFFLLSYIEFFIENRNAKAHKAAVLYNSYEKQGFYLYEKDFHDGGCL